MSSSRDQSSSRRYASITSDFRSKQERPTKESHFPDPLFGGAINSANAMPSEFDREKLSPSLEGYRSRSASIARSAPDSSRERLSSASPDVKDFHHSMPEIGYYGLERDPYIEEYSLHQSLPDLVYSKLAPGEVFKKKAARDTEPVPDHLRHVGWCDQRGGPRVQRDGLPSRRAPDAAHLEILSRRQRI